MSAYKLLSTLAIAAFCLTALASTGSAPAMAARTAPAGAERTVTKMIDAVKAQSYGDFMAEADAQLKAQFSRQQFEGICGLYTAQLRKGYKLEHLGQLRQRGATVLLWKITVVDSPDEALSRVVMKEGKVAGFSVH